MSLRLSPPVTPLVALLLLVCGAASALAAQEGTGAVEGVASSEEDAAPIPFALIRLLSVVEQQTVATQQAITSARGEFRFASVPPGEYRLQLLRIGYRPILSPVVRVKAGETLRHQLRGPTQAIELAPVIVRAGPHCVTVAQLAEEPRLATLWSEARKGVETRRTFERQYRFTRYLRQDIEIRLQFRKTRREVREDTLVSEPDSVLAREERRRAASRTRGYAEGNLLTLPDERDLLDDAFMRDHCLETSIDEAGGALGLRFRPVRPRRDGADVRGTIWVDAQTYQVRRLELEYVEGQRPFARTRVDYADVPVGGSVLRLPSGGWASMRARGATRVLVSRASATFTFTYRDFEPVSSR